jgi:hypothetical protein
MQGWAEAVDRAALVRAGLEAAGRTLLCLPGRGIFPAGYRSSMPDYAQVPTRGEPGYWAQLSEAVRSRPPPPSPQAIRHMDEVYTVWIGLLPRRTELDVVVRRIVLLRSLTRWDVDPASERRHVWTWVELGRLFRVSDKTARARWEVGVDRIVRRLPEARRRDAPAPARIAA